MGIGEARTGREGLGIVYSHLRASHVSDNELLLCGEMRLNGTKMQLFRHDLWHDTFTPGQTDWGGA